MFALYGFDTDYRKIETCLQDKGCWESSTRTCKPEGAALPGLTIAFHLISFNERGVVRSTIDFAHFNETMLGNQSIIVAPKDYHCDRTLTPSIMEPMVRNRFKVFDYDNIAHMQSILKSQGVDLFYIQKSGGIDDLHGGETPTGIHAVFEFTPHREKYAYISSWMAIEAEKNTW